MTRMTKTKTTTAEAKMMMDKTMMTRMRMEPSKNRKKDKVAAKMAVLFLTSK